MRLIDADALTEYLKCLFPARGVWEIEGDTAKDAICETVVEAMEMVKNMETIKPEPERKTGKWIERDVIYKPEASKTIEEWQSAKCSVCGKYHTTPFLYYFENYNFCPHCGARMEGQDG